MKTLELTLAMGLLLMPFGCGDRESRYHSNADHERNVANQVRMTPQTVEQLRAHGVGTDTTLRLEFFFYTDAKAKAEDLASDLRELGYDAGLEATAIDDGTFVVTGWTTRIRMDTATVVEWTRKMCDLGYTHDAEFDGWGTNPEQDQPPQQGDATDDASRLR